MTFGSLDPVDLVTTDGPMRAFIRYFRAWLQLVNS
jgi:hypothetical protein